MGDPTPMARLPDRLHAGPIDHLAGTPNSPTNLHLLVHLQSQQDAWGIEGHGPRVCSFRGIS